MIDLLHIPGTYRRPSTAARSFTVPGRGTSFTTRGVPARDVRLAPDGEAAWQFADGAWSSSGHWKIVKGQHLSIVAVSDDVIARARGEDLEEFYYHLLATDESHLRVRTTAGVEETWQRV
jgi:hypothetical protein